jgi:hypothetical protein
LVQRGGTLHFDEGAGVSVGDLFDNNNDGAGYINNAGTVDTEPHGFTVKNKMPIRNVGSMVIDSVTLGFLRAVAGKDYTYGVSVYMPLVGFPDPTPAITLKSPGTLLCDLGYRQDGGALQVGGLSGSVNLQSNLTGDSSVLLNSGTISFPSGTAYVALNFVLPDATSSVQFGSNGDFGMAVTMKVDPTNTQVGVWIGDTVTTNGRYLFAAGNRSSLTINQSVAGTVQPGSWDLFTSGTAKSGDWPAGSITNNLAGTTTQWDTPNNKKFSVKK